MTVGLESVILVFNVDEHVKRYTEFSESPDEYPRTDVYKTTAMVLKGVISELLNLIEPKMYYLYKYLINNSNIILYGKMQKSLYGYKMVELLFYEQLSK